MDATWNLRWTFQPAAAPIFAVQGPFARQVQLRAAQRERRKARQQGHEDFTEIRHRHNYTNKRHRLAKQRWFIDQVGAFATFCRGANMAAT